MSINQTGQLEFGKTVKALQAFARHVSAVKDTDIRVYNLGGAITVMQMRDGALVPIAEDTTRGKAYTLLEAALLWLPEPIDG
ncbi:MAG: hypothetical protein GY719_10095 [bacterium]|nr:hypothetical protein [bacterium]